MDFTSLNSKLQEASKYFPAETEKTIFSIGGRGYFENPTSDVLAFFLNPREVHGFGNLFLASLFRCMKMYQDNKPLELVEPPKREVVIDEGKRIDLILEGKDWVLVIENKINHYQSNPFGDYEKYAEKEYTGKNMIFLILSPEGESVAPEWEALSYGQYIHDVKQNLGAAAIEAPYSKWHVFLRDFLLNLEHYATRNKMNLNAVEFVEKNYLDLHKLNNLRETYYEHIKNNGLEKLNTLFEDQEISTAIHKWPHGPAIRYYSKSWIGDSNLVIYLSHNDADKGFSLHMYAYEIEEAEIEATDNALKKNLYDQSVTESGSIRCYRSNIRYEKYEDLISDFEKTACMFNSFNVNRSIAKSIE